MTTRITIRKPDDWHLHVRDGAMLKAVLPFTARNFRPRHPDAEPGAAGQHRGRWRRPTASGPSPRGRRARPLRR